MTPAYEVRQLPVWPEIQQLRLESRGSRRKFWISIEGEPNLWLLKYPRPYTGEHWAEKIAAEVGKLIGVDCARVELADSGGDLVTVCESFFTEFWLDAYDSNDSTREWREEEQRVDDSTDGVVHVDSAGAEETFFLEGRDVLAWSDELYDVDARFRQREHSVGNIVRAVKEMFRDLSDPEISNVDDILRSLASYVLLDGLIGNTDRHHENWMLKMEFDAGLGWLASAPSFDHASSLGRELRDDRRRQFMDSNAVLAYLLRGRGGVYDDSGDRHAPAPLVLAQTICRRWSDYCTATLDRIGNVDDVELWSTVNKVPAEIMSATAKDFAFEVIQTSRRELLNCNQ